MPRRRKISWIAAIGVVLLLAFAAVLTNRPAPRQVFVAEMPSVLLQTARPWTEPPESPSASPSISPPPLLPSPERLPERPADGPAKPTVAAGRVFFQNAGSITGWSNYPQKPQKNGVIRTVSSPAFKGHSSIEARQTYLDGQGGGYHSETIQAAAQRVGEDRYFGQAIYVRPDWTFHSQNVTFQQFSPEDPAGPWLLMFIQDDKLRYSGRNVGSGTIASIASLRGTWIRIVTRIKMAKTGGVLEIWVNGKKLVSTTGNVAPDEGKSIRWSSGIYCTGWRDGLPTGPHVLSIFHANARVASTYALAEPGNW